MNSPTIPQQQIPRVSINLNNLRTPLLEPFNLLIIKAMPIVGNDTPFRILLLGMRREVFFEKRFTSFHHHQTAVVGPIGVQVDDSLDALFAGDVWILVDVWPARRRGRCRWLWECEVYAIEGG